MDLKIEMRMHEQFGELARLDRPQGCYLCGATGPKIGIENLRMISEWWLSPAQRTAWHVTTLIQGRQAHEGPNMDAVFKIATPVRKEPIPVLLVVCQHHEGKNLPHYQLQAPTGDIMKSLKDIRQEIAPLYSKCDIETARFRVKGSKSISLHEPLITSELQVLHSSISTFVLGIREILEMRAAPEAR